MPVQKKKDAPQASPRDRDEGWGKRKEPSAGEKGGGIPQKWRNMVHFRPWCLRAMARFLLRLAKVMVFPSGERQRVGKHEGRASRDDTNVDAKLMVYSQTQCMKKPHITILAT